MTQMSPRSEEGEGERVLGSGPVLGGGGGPEAGGGGGGQGVPPVPPPRRGEGPDDYNRRFEEAAKVFGSDAFTIKRIEELRRQNIPAALFLGVRTTGKTWLLQRMKQQFKVHFTCKPPFAVTKQAVTSEEVQGRDLIAYGKENNVAVEPVQSPTTERAAGSSERLAAGETGRSSAIVIHRFLSASENFALIDVPGEAMEDLANENYGALRGLLAALEYAKIVIVALPSDVVLLSSEMLRHPELEDQPGYQELKDDYERTDAFTDAIGILAATRSLLHHKGIKVRWKAAGDPPDAFDEAITSETVEAHLTDPQNFCPIGGHDGLECPAFFALTKADKFFATIGELPDGAATNEEVRKALEDYNNKLSASDEGKFLTRVFRLSSAHKRNLREHNDWWTKFTGMIFGKDDPVIPISNPPEMLKRLSEPLFNRLTEYFPMSRFDMVAAFYGHTDNTLKLEDFHRYESIGIDVLVDWLGAAHDDGIGHWHVWARSVFARIYPTRRYRGPFGSRGRRASPTKKESHASAKRLNFFPPSLLAKMFRKERHLSQTVPYLLTVLVIGLMALVTFDPLEESVYPDGRNYEAFVAAINETMNGRADPSIAALVNLPVMPIGTTGPTAGAKLRYPTDGLTGWNGRSGGSITVPKDLSQVLPVAGDSVDNWRKTYVCGLQGWGRYRNIVRKAVINDFGTCGPVRKLVLQSWAIERLGAVGGGLVLIVGWILALGLVAYCWWYAFTRRAYAWLYHSGVATTRRPAKAEE